MGVIAWIVFGLIIGAVARAVMPGRQPGGIIVTILLGVGGSLLGGWLGYELGMYPSSQGGGGFFMSILGAVVILGIYRAISRPRVIA